MTLPGVGVDPDSQTYLTYLLLKQLPHLAPPALTPHLYTLAHTGRAKAHGTQLPQLLTIGKGAPPPSSSSSRITSVSSYAGSFVRERLDEILVVRGRGFTRTPHPDDPLLLDSVDEGPGIIPQPLHHHYDHQVSSVYTTPASSGRSSPTVESNSTLTPSHGGWTTGNETDRSSLDSSYCWDEFDRQAARTVTQHFDEIERCLFGEGCSEKTSAIKNECRDWSTHFPHLRILGTQKFEPQDTGYREYPRDSPRHSTGLLLDVTDNDITISSDSQGLILTGRGMKPMKAPVDGTSLHSNSNNEYAHLMEEVFDQDGVYEEVIAVDYKDIHEDSENKKQITPRRRRIGYPPITPNACVKDSVASSVFDCIWNEIIAWMRPLLKECSLFLSDSKQDLVPNSSYQVSTLLNDPGPSTRESSYLGIIHKSIPPYGMTRAHTITATTEHNSSISEILQINSITLNPKNRTAQEPSDTNTTMNSKRPVSKTQNRVRRGQLAPIPHNNRSQTPMGEDVVANNALHVKSITFQKSSAYPPYQRNTALPPLAYTDIQQDKTAKRKNSSVRASSAIDNKDVRNWHHFHRERQPVDPRPSTTHAMRSDTPLGSTGRRSSTPLGYGKGFHNGNKSLGITGNSLQHPSDIVHPYPNIMEDEGMEESPLHNQFPIKSRTRATLRT